MKRGYNQSEVVARSVASRLQIPFLAGALSRTRYTPEQTRKTRTDRQANVHHAFRVRRSIKIRGKSILLIDDVMTTCSTVNEAAKALRKAGAANVIVAVVARAQI